MSQKVVKSIGGISLNGRAAAPMIYAAPRGMSCRNWH
jgi:hypothetical protein